MSLVAVLNVCAWLLVATGLFQIVVSKLSKFQWVRELEACLLNAVSVVVRGFLLVAGGTREWGDGAVPGCHLQAVQVPAGERDGAREIELEACVIHAATVLQ